MTLRAASLGPAARLARAPLGGLRPPRASLRCAGSRAPPWGAAPRVPGPTPGPHPCRSLPLPSVAPHKGVRACRAVGPAFCALRVLPRRGPCPCARPLRRGAPAAASRGRSAVCGLRRPRAVPCAPPLPRSASCALARSVGARCRRLPAGPPSRRCGLPSRSPLLCSCLALVQRVGPWGAAAAPRWASSLAPPAAPLGLRARRLPAGAPGRASGPLPPLRGPRLGCAPAPARACWCLCPAVSVSVGSPLRPPAPPPPLGAPGCARPA